MVWVCEQSPLAMATIRSALLQHSVSASLDPDSCCPPVRSLSFRRSPSPCLSFSPKCSPLDHSCFKSLLPNSVSASGADTSLDSDLGLSYERLRDLLAAGEWQLADEETRRLVLVLGGENALKRKYVFFSEVQFMPATDLCTIDRLWRLYSNDKFGYSVQRKIWKRLDGDCTAFFKKVGWMKPLGSDSPQFTYRAFPTEFKWELSSSTPEGHLPLTNALRGQQLLKSLLDHPAFSFADEDLMAPSSPSDRLSGESSRPPSQQQKPITPLPANYSF